MAWKKPTTTPKKKEDRAFPDLKGGKGTSLQYEELQQNELIALEAIYGDDFRRLKQAHTAWKVCPLPDRHSATDALLRS